MLVGLIMQYTEGRIWMIPTWIEVREHWPPNVTDSHFYRHMMICDLVAYSRHYAAEEDTRILIHYKDKDKPGYAKRAYVKPDTCLFDNTMRIGSPEDICRITFVEVFRSQWL